MLVLGSGSLKGTTGSPTVATTEQRWKEVEDELSFFFFFGRKQSESSNMSSLYTDCFFFER